MATAIRRTAQVRGRAITHLIAGVLVSDLDAGIDWYMRFVGAAPRYARWG